MQRVTGYNKGSDVEHSDVFIVSIVSLAQKVRVKHALTTVLQHRQWLIHCNFIREILLGTVILVRSVPDEIAVRKVVITDIFYSGVNF